MRPTSLRQKEASGPTALAVTKASAVQSEGGNTSPVPERGLSKRLSPAERRAQIVDVTERLFATHAYSEVSVPDVARAAGITPGLVYHYFPTKEALFLAAYEVRARELLLFCEPEPRLPFEEQVHRGVRGYLDFVEAHGQAYLNLFHGPAVAGRVACGARMRDDVASSWSIDLRRCPASARWTRRSTPRAPPRAARLHRIFRERRPLLAREEAGRASGTRDDAAVRDPRGRPGRSRERALAAHVARRGGEAHATVPQAVRLAVNRQPGPPTRPRAVRVTVVTGTSVPAA